MKALPAEYSQYKLLTLDQCKIKVSGMFLAGESSANFFILSSVRYPQPQLAELPALRRISTSR
jgi:hypothetical protein